MKRYGQLVKERATLTDETIEKITYGVIKREGKWFCVQCETVQNHHFYQYHSAFFKEPITYCRHCITMGRMDSVHKVVLPKRIINVQLEIMRFLSNYLPNNNLHLLKL